MMRRLLLMIASADSVLLPISSDLSDTASLAASAGTKYCRAVEDMVDSTESFNISAVNQADTASRQELIDIIRFIRGDLSFLEVNDPYGALVTPIWIAAVIVLCLSCLAWWTVFPCCRCRKAHVSSKRRGIKSGVMLALVGVLIGASLSMISALQAIEQIWRGADLTLCGISRGISITLQGTDDFVGVIPAMKLANKAYSDLDPNSQFMKAVNNETKSSVRSILGPVKQINGSATSLKNALNVSIEYHKLARDLREKEFSVVDADDLVPSHNWSAAMQSKLDSYIPEMWLREVLQSVNQISRIQPILKIDIAFWLPIADWFALVIPIVVGVFWIIGAIFVMMFLFRHDSPTQSSDGLIVEFNDKRRNPYSRCISCVTCSTWFSVSILSIVIIFLMGVLSFGIRYPAQACILADNIDSATVIEIASAAGYQIDNQTQVRLNATMERCLYGDGTILDELQAVCDNSECRTVDQNNLQNAMAEFDKLLNDVANQLDSHVENIRKNPYLEALRQFPETPEALIIVDTEEIVKDGSYVALLYAKSLVGLISSLACENVTVNQNFPTDYITSATDKILDDIVDVDVDVDGKTIEEKVKGRRDDLLDTFFNDTHTTIPGINHFAEEFIEKPSIAEVLSSSLSSLFVNPIPEDDLPEGTCAKINPIPDRYDTMTDDESKWNDAFDTFVQCYAVRSFVNQSDENKQQFNDSYSVLKQAGEKRQGNRTALQGPATFLANTDPLSQSLDRITCDVRTAAINLIKLKNEIRKNESFDCFTDKSVPCNITQWARHVKDLAKNITTEVDDALDRIPEVKNEATTTIRRRANQTFFDPASDVLARANCSYIRMAKKDIVEGICVETMNGVRQLMYSYFALGVAAFLLFLMLYPIWNYWSNNRAAWERERKRKSNKRRSFTSQSHRPAIDEAMKRPSTSEEARRSMKRPSTSEEARRSTKRPSTSVEARQSTKRPSTSMEPGQSTKRSSTTEAQARRSTKRPSTTAQVRRPSATDEARIRDPPWNSTHDTPLPSAPPLPDQEGGWPSSRIVDV